MTKKVAIVEDDPEIRGQIVKLLTKAPDIVCVGVFASAEEALQKIGKLNPDVVLMDIKLPGISGIDCVPKIKRDFPKIQIIMVTVYEDDERIFKALKAGADGYIIKSDSPDRLADAIRNAYTNGDPMSIPIARKVIQFFHQLGASSRESDNLSPREREVLELLARGFIYKEISDSLKISVLTVRSHVENICSKMHVRTRLEAVAKHQRRHATPF